jgi:leucyl/phenylalanyl-tRNA--protein transferase
MIHWWSREIRGDALDMLWHYASGELTLYESKADVGKHVKWVKYSHRGVQMLDKVEFPRKEKRYIFSPRFEVKVDTAFEAVVEGCGDPERDQEEGTWFNPEVRKGYLNLHKLGFAHSFETWMEGKLVGGALFVQIGGFVACNSLFHTVSNASKAAWGQALVMLKERGFRWVDVNCVAAHHVNYGEEWVPQWKFEKMMREEMGRELSIAEGIAAPKLPWRVRMGLPVARVVRGIGRRFCALRRGGAGDYTPGHGDLVQAGAQVRADGDALVLCQRREPVLPQRNDERADGVGEIQPSGDPAPGQHPHRGETETGCVREEVRVSDQPGL